MVRTRATVRRLPEKAHQLPPWMVNREYGKKIVYRFKIKQTLPSQKTVKDENKNISAESTD